MRCLFVLILFIFFPLATKLIGPLTGCQSFKKKNVDFSDTHPLNSMSHLRGCVSVLGIVFVGQCELFVCLDFVHFFPLGCEAHRSANGVSILQKLLIFPDTCPLKGGKQSASTG